MMWKSVLGVGQIAAIGLNITSWSAAMFWSKSLEPASWVEIGFLSALIPLSIAIIIRFDKSCQ